MSHLRAAFADPGRIPEGFSPPFASEYFEMKNCEKCPGKETWKPPRSHHCSECNVCVFKMDHHCPWVNNCVGHGNMKYFLQFVFYIMLASAMLSFLCVMSFVNLLSSQNTRQHMNHGVSILSWLVNGLQHFIVELPLRVHWEHFGVRGGATLRLLHFWSILGINHFDWWQSKLRWRC